MKKQAQQPFNLKFCVLNSYRKLKELNEKIAYQFAEQVGLIHKAYKKMITALDKTIILPELSHISLKDKISFFEEKMREFSAWAQASIEATFDLLLSLATKNKDTSVLVFIPIVK